MPQCKASSLGLHQQVQPQRLSLYQFRGATKLIVLKEGMQQGHEETTTITPPRGHAWSRGLAGGRGFLQKHLLSSEEFGGEIRDGPLLAWCPSRSWPCCRSLSESLEKDQYGAVAGVSWRLDSEDILVDVVIFDMKCFFEGGGFVSEEGSEVLGVDVGYSSSCSLVGATYFVDFEQGLMF
jgi:hypothetical protein